MADNENSIRCRYCGQRNQIRTESGDAPRCGRCRLPLSDAPHKKFARLDKDQYIHPDDRRALAALRASPGIDSALKKLLALTGESAIRVIFTASAVKVTPTQCPDLYAKLQIACTTLGVDMPELFVQQNPVVNAFTGGVEKPIIVLHSALIERLNDEETLAVIAYRQPITAAEITEVRGVNTSGVLNTLLERHLIKIVGRKQVVGRPFMYATTKEFLIRFGLNDLTDLPKVEDMAEALGLEAPILTEQTPTEEMLPLDEPEEELDDDEDEPGESIH